MLETLEIDPYLAEQYLEEISEMESGPLAALSGLELAPAGPKILTDFERFIQEQFNLEPFNDISIESYYLEGIPPNLRLDKRDYIVVDEDTGATSNTGACARGDIVSGAATVILAMGEGRKASTAMHRYQMGEEHQSNKGSEGEP